MCGPEAYGWISSADGTEARIHLDIIPTLGDVEMSSQLQFQTIVSNMPYCAGRDDLALSYDALSSEEHQA